MFTEAHKQSAFARAVVISYLLLSAFAGTRDASKHASA
jgi:hypothetical protein